MSSQKSTLDEWKHLLKETRDHEAELVDLVSLREELKLAYSRTFNTRGMRDTLLTSARDASRRLRESFAEGRVAAGKLRRFVKSVRRAR